MSGIRPTLSVRLSLPSGATLQVFAVSIYEEPLRSLVRATRWGGYEASRNLGTIMYSHTVLSSIQADYLVPVPLHPKRYAQRGYNQAKLMADRIAELSSIPVLDCVLRIRNTAQQSQCLRFERYANVSGAFRLAYPVDLAKKHVIIIDDVMSSGATLREIAGVLNIGRPATMRALVACICD
jgi:ComF family protein